MMQKDYFSIKRLTPAHGVRAMVFGAAVFAVFWVVTHVSWWCLMDVMGIEIRDLDQRYWPEFIVVFVLFFGPLLYLVGCITAKKRLVLDPAKLVLYMGCTFFGAMWFEIILDTLFVTCTGQPGWIYKVWPIHHGYTSGVGMVMWPLYGFFVYCMNAAVENNSKLAKINHAAAMTFLFALDAMALEILTNLFAIVLYHTYLFYYLPGDLRHFTTVQIFVPYLFACGLGSVFSFYFERLKQFHLVIGLSFYLAGIGSLFFVA